MSTDVGKVFEKQLEKALDLLKASHHLGWHRFSDSGSAGGAFIQQQPADYLMGVPPGSAGEQRLFFIEAKASETHKSLKLEMMQPSQRGAIHFYGGLLKIPYYVLFWDVQGSRLELWDGVEVVKRKRGKKPLCNWEAVSTWRNLNEQAVADLICARFQLPDPALTLSNYED